MCLSPSIFEVYSLYSIDLFAFSSIYDSFQSVSLLSKSAAVSIRDALRLCVQRGHSYTSLYFYLGY